MDFIMNKLHISLRQLQRGPTSNLIFTIVRHENLHKISKSSDTININNQVELLVSFTFSDDFNCTPLVRMKSKAGAQDSAVPITIQCDTFKELFFCSADWVEVTLNPVLCVSQRRVRLYNNPPYTTISLYSIEINVTLQVVMPSIFLPKKELYEDTESTDFQLHAADGTIAVHKAVLFLHSDIFKEKLKMEWKGLTEDRISMDGISVQTLEHLKDYMYLGTLPDVGLEPLLQLAAHYGINQLVDNCSTKLVNTVKPENIDGLIALGCKFNVPELVRGLVLRIPADVQNCVYDLQINDHKI